MSSADGSVSKIMASDGNPRYNLQMAVKVAQRLEKG